MKFKANLATPPSLVQSFGAQSPSGASRT